MKHMSKFDGREYFVTRSYDADNNGNLYNHDVCLVWREGVLYGEDEPRTFIGWYYGDYDYQWTEDIVQEYYEGISKKRDIKMKTIDLPICYVNLITDCLQTIKRHKLYSLLGCYDGNEDKDFLDSLKFDINDVLKSICKPLDELDQDTKIIIEEDK